MPTIVGDDTDSLWLPALQDGINRKVRGYQLKPLLTTPTWQQTLISGSILTQNNTVEADQFSFNLNNSSRLEFGTSYPGYDSKSWYVQSPLFDDGEAGHTFFHTSEDATDTSIYQFYGALYFKPYGGVYIFDRMPSTLTPATDSILVIDDAGNVGKMNQDAFAGNLGDILIEDVINDGIVNKAPSENAVFDALALKLDIADLPAAQNLQQVTDIGNQTTNNIIVNGDTKAIRVTNAGNSGSASLEIDNTGFPSLDLQWSNDEVGGNIRVDNLSEHKIYQLPNTAVTETVLAVSVNGKYAEDDGSITLTSDDLPDINKKAENINTSTTDVGNIGSGEDDLITYAIPAGKLATNGDYAEFTMTLSFAANANNKQVKLYYGATNFYASGAQAQDNGTMEITGKIVRTSATTQKITFHQINNTALFPDYANFATASETMANAITLKATGEATSDNDIVQKILLVKYFPGN